VGRYLGAGSFDWLWRFGRANGKGGGVGLGRSEEAELWDGLSSIDSHLFTT
jgi:hypothetical protein